MLPITTQITIPCSMHLIGNSKDGWLSCIPEVKPPFQDESDFIVTHPFFYIAPNRAIVVIEQGFHTDFASIPRFLRAFYGNTGKEASGSVIHDKGYRNGRAPLDVIEMEFVDGLWVATGVKVQAFTPDKDFWDTTFFRINRLSKCSDVRNYSMYAGLYVGGWAAWGGYRRKENANVGSKFLTSADRALVMCLEQCNKKGKV